MVVDRRPLRLRVSRDVRSDPLGCVSVRDLTALRIVRLDPVLRYNFSGRPGSVVTKPSHKSDAPAAWRNDMAEAAHTPFEVACPCCGALLKIDAELHRVISQRAPHRHSRSADIDHAGSVLQKDAQRREALFRQSEEAEKVKFQLLDRKFAEALEKTRGEPVTRPPREIDLD